MTDAFALIDQMTSEARAAAQVLAQSPAAQRDEALRAAAAAIRASRAEIITANQEDLARGRANDMAPAMLDRLALDEARVDAIAGGLEAIAAQPDPVGRVLAEWDRPNGLKIRRVSTPLGVLGVIYESRPNVTADAGGLALKSGNAVILRGGSDSVSSAAAIHRAMVAGLREAGLPDAAIGLVPTTDRAAVSAMLAAQGKIDVIVPRGGKGLVSLVHREARVPVFAHLDGVCHIYVDASAAPEMARKIVLNAKTRRPGICGAAECLLIDRAYLAAHGTELLVALREAGVELRASDELADLPDVTPAQPEDFGHEFLAMIMAVRPVDGIDGAISHIRTYSSGHTEAIISENPATVEAFYNQLDSAILMHNASTQFADGGEFGMGAEIGIATGKIHARGPVGAEQLTTFKYLVEGHGAVRA